MVLLLKVDIFDKLILGKLFWLFLPNAFAVNFKFIVSCAAGNYKLKVKNRSTGTRDDNMFKVNNKDTWTTPMAPFWCFYC